MIMLDTNAAIYYLQNDPKTIAVIGRLRRNQQSFMISTITELEIFSFSSLTIEQVVPIDLWLQELNIVPPDSTIARLGAQLRRQYHLKTPDALIAATAIRYGAPLLTRDKSFRKLKELRVLPC